MGLMYNLPSDRTGDIRVELRDDRFRLIPGRDFQSFYPLYGDLPSVKVSWKGDRDLKSHVGKTIYVSFRLRSAKLYSVAAVE